MSVDRAVEVLAARIKTRLDTVFLVRAATRAALARQAGIYGPYKTHLMYWREARDCWAEAERGFTDREEESELSPAVDRG